MVERQAFNFQPWTPTVSLYRPDIIAFKEEKYRMLGWPENDIKELKGMYSQIWEETKLIAVMYEDITMRIYKRKTWPQIRKEVNTDKFATSFERASSMCLNAVNHEKAVGKRVQAVKALEALDKKHSVESIHVFEGGKVDKLHEMDTLMESIWPENSTKSVDIACKALFNPRISFADKEDKGGELTCNQIRLRAILKDRLAESLECSEFWDHLLKEICTRGSSENLLWRLLGFFRREFSCWGIAQSNDVLDTLRLRNLEGCEQGLPSFEKRLKVLQDCAQVM